MSKKSIATSSVRGAAKAAAGSHLTVQARMTTAERFVDVLYERGFQVRGVSSIGARHVAAYVEARRNTGVSVRTMQNEASHIRGVLVASGRQDLANNTQISNKSLGISGSSRLGTNTAATREEFQSAVTRMTERDPGLAAILKLERTLGLRSQEAIRAGASLGSWEKQLSVGDRVHIMFGTKGGRDRYTVPSNRADALDAVREAKAIADVRGGRLLWGGLKSASSYYRNEMYRHCKLTGHQLRYAYAQDMKEQYLTAGYTLKEARSLVSISLGHGDGRGRYVSQVYCNSADT